MDLDVTDRQLLELIPYTKDRLLSYIASDADRLDYNKDILNLDPYIYLHNFSIESSKVSANISSFLLYFYRSFKGLDWYDSHLDNHSLFFGYWSFSIAAIVKKVNADDKDFIDHMFYPRDLTGRTLLKTWQDSEEGFWARAQKEKFLQEDMKGKLQNDEAMKIDIRNAISAELKRKWGDQSKRIFSDAFLSEVNKINSDKKYEDSFEDQEKLQNFLSKLGREIQGLDLQSKMIDYSEIASSVEKTMLKYMNQEDIDTIRLVQKELQGDDFRNTMNDLLRSYQLFGESLVQMGETYEANDQEYWDKLDELIKKNGLEDTTDKEQLKMYINNIVRERFKDMDSDGGKYSFNLGDFL